MGSTSTPCCSGSTPPRHASPLLGVVHAGLVRGLRPPGASVTETCVRPRCGSGVVQLGGGRWRRRRHGASDAGHHRSRRRGRLVRSIRRGRPRRCRGQGPRASPTARPAGHAQGQTRAHRRLRGGRLPVAQVRTLWWGRCSSASTTTRVSCIMSGCRLRSPPHVVASWWTRSPPTACDSLEGHPWAAWAAPAEAERPHPGGAVAVERQQGPELGAARPLCSCARWPTTISRATGSATPPRSGAGGLIDSPIRAPTRNSTWSCPTELAAVFGA